MNENCLEGIRCPVCGNNSSFKIEARVTCAVTDDGSVVEDGDHEWDDDSSCVCSNCGESGTVSDFDFSGVNGVVLVLDNGVLKEVHTNSDYDVDLTIVDLAKFRKIGQEKEALHNIDVICRHITDDNWDLNAADAEKLIGLESTMKACSEICDTVDEKDYDDASRDPDNVDPDTFVPIKVMPVKSANADPNVLP